MIQFYLAYQPLVDLFLINIGYAFSQYIVLRTGMFAVAGAGLAAIGAYVAAGLVVKLGIDPWLSIVAGTIVSTLFALLLAWPLARLRGVYQAIATLAFVQVVLALNLYAEDFTGGAMGLFGIPKAVDTPLLLLAALGTIYLMYAINATRVGRAFEAIRQDEAVAASLGASVTFYQTLALAISGALAGFFAGLDALHGYALQPNRFGFHFVVAALSFVILGGRRSILGPVVGTALLVSLPEFARPLAENRDLVYGLLLMVVITYMPRGVVDTLLEHLNRRRMAASGPKS